MGNFWAILEYLLGYFGAVYWIIFGLFTALFMALFWTIYWAISGTYNVPIIMQLSKSGAPTDQYYRATGIYWAILGLFWNVNWAILGLFIGLFWAIYLAIYGTLFLGYLLGYFRDIWGGGIYGVVLRFICVYLCVFCVFLFSNAYML